MNDPQRNFTDRDRADRDRADRDASIAIRFFSLSKMFAVIALAFPLLASSSARAGSPLDGDLFSEISMSETVVGATQQTRTPTPTQMASSGVVLGPGSLTKVLSADGIKCTLESQAVRVAVADLMPTSPDAGDLGTLRFSVDAEADRIDVVLPLKSLSIHRSVGGATVDGEKLMQLLVALQSHVHVQLVAAETTLAFHSSLSNHDVTPDRLRTVAGRLASAATNTSRLVTAVIAERSIPKAEQPQPTATSTTLVGTWSAKTSASDAWAVRFHEDGNFVMVHTRSGKNSVSRGRYQATADRLVLSESAGVTLTGTLQRSSAKAFRWQLQNASGEEIATLAFSQQ